ncbi:MAG TPA: DNA adenine methylase [Polyangia bacterium]|nr:DNA adenine methylase [Polyangia bacterium]
MQGDAPAPFLKWVGGKRQLLPRILDLAPDRIDTYYEPFVGGGAVFFALAGQRRFARAVLGDANPELVSCYQAVRDDIGGVIAALRKHRNTKEDYYRVRAEDPERLSRAARAARVIYLNRCGYNGLYRVNSDGRFNVPFGRYARPNICDVPRLEAASRALANVEIVCGDFRDVLADRPGEDDFVYLDPPYVPISRTASFTAYAQRAFGPDDQRRLADALRALSRARVPALLSNSYCSDTRRLYADLRFRKVPARRAINSVGRNRGPVSEILVRTAAIR